MQSSRYTWQSYDATRFFVQFKALEHGFLGLLLTLIGLGLVMWPLLKVTSPSQKAVRLVPISVLISNYVVEHSTFPRSF